MGAGQNWRCTSSLLKLSSSINSSFFFGGYLWVSAAWVRGSLAHGSNSVGRWMNGAEWRMGPAFTFSGLSSQAWAGRWSFGSMLTAMCTLHPGVLFEVTALQVLKFALRLAPSFTGVASLTKSGYLPAVPRRPSRRTPPPARPAAPRRTCKVS